MLSTVNKCKEVDYKKEIMEKKKLLLKDMPKVDPFKTPEGYFENFTDTMMSQLPDTGFRENLISVNWWQKVRPWVYMAAMFAGIALMLRLFVGSPTTQNGLRNHASEGLNLTSSSDIDDYYQYYEDGLARIAYDDAFYLTNYTEDAYSE